MLRWMCLLKQKVDEAWFNTEWVRRLFYWSTTYCLLTRVEIKQIVQIRERKFLDNVEDFRIICAVYLKMTNFDYTSA